MVVNEGFLEGMKMIPLCHSLNCLDLFPFNINRESDTGIYRTYIHEHSASPARADSTCFLDTRQVQVLPEDLKQCTVRPDKYLMVLAVDSQHSPSFHSYFSQGKWPI
jgi:hypothetical protein